MKNESTLFELTFNQANEKGKLFLNTWIKAKEVTGVYFTADNWFYISVLSNRNEYKRNAAPEFVPYFYAISQKSDCASSTFGDERHFKNTVKKESIIQTVLN